MDHAHHMMHAMGGGMDHDMPGMPDHGGHGGGTAPKCSMNMLWNTDIIDTCIVFPQWHISSNFDFILSFFAIVALGVFYEYLREFQRRADVKIARSLRGPTTGAGAAVSDRTVDPSEEDPLLTDCAVVKGRKIVAVPPFARIYRAALYGATIFLSFFLMLVFMTYNAYLILAVVLGASLGHFIFGGNMDPDAILVGGGGGKTMACH